MNKEENGIEKMLNEKPIILAVDDMAVLLSTVSKLLEEYYTVIAVSSGKGALKSIEKYTPALFLLDIEMDEMNGFELASRLRSNERFTDTPIVFLTAKGTRTDVINAIKHGGNDYVIKPVNRDLLLHKIQQYLP